MPKPSLVKHTFDLQEPNRKHSITFEYVMLDQVNDQIEHAKQLVKIIQTLPSKVNLIPFNPVEGLKFESPRPFNVAQFDEMLRDSLINVTIRRSRGVDIKGACGQLRAEHKKN